MELTSDNLYRLALLIMFVFAIAQIYYYFNHETIMIETEHMDPSIYNMISTASMYENPPQFYLKDNRYAVENKHNPTLVDPLTSDPQLSCAPKFDWQTKHNPGANGTYGDMMWHKQSPRMILEKNCLNCNQYNPTNDFNEPMGMSSPLTSSFDEEVVEGAFADQKILDDSFAKYNMT